MKEHTLHSFDDRGNWIESVWSLGSGLRERLWFAMAFLEYGEERTVRIANRIIEGSTYAYCAFSPMIALQMLIKYDGKLAEPARVALQGYLQQVLPEFRGSEHDFVGVNDNFPCMGTYIALMGGKLLNPFGT